ncbi:MAG: hypothetical protein JNL38_27280, partial [Myxococcales bacterium]|nr:hypothetical protein [Myxococcales bacterium]
MVGHRLAGLVVLLAIPAALGGCEEEKKKPGAVPSASSPATATAAPSTTASAAPTATASATPPKKKIVECPQGPEVKTEDTALLAEIRRKLSKKPDEPVKMAELANVKSINLTSATVNELEPCIFPKLTNLKHL